MSGLEIERKFLIRKGGSWKDAAFSAVTLTGPVKTVFAGEISY